MSLYLSIQEQKGQFVLGFSLRDVRPEHWHPPWGPVKWATNTTYNYDQHRK